MNSFNNSDQADFDKIASGLNKIDSGIKQTNSTIRTEMGSQKAVLSQINSGTQNFGKKIAMMSGNPATATISDALSKIGPTISQSISGAMNSLHGHGDQGIIQAENLNAQKIVASINGLEDSLSGKANRFNGSGGSGGREKPLTASDLRAVLSSMPQAVNNGGAALGGSPRSPGSLSSIQGRVNTGQQGPADVAALLCELIKTQKEFAQNFTDPNAKQGGGILSTLWDLGKDLTGINILFSGRYAKDIKRSANPLETMTDALIKIYEWERIGIDLSRRQLNEIIKATGGKPQKYVGHEGVLTTVLKRGVGKLKSAYDESALAKVPILGKLGKGALNLGSFFMGFNDEDWRDQMMAKWYNGLSSFVEGKGLRPSSNKHLNNDYRVNQYKDSILGSDVDYSEYGKMRRDLNRSFKAEDTPRFEKVMADPEIQRSINDINAINQADISKRERKKLLNKVKKQLKQSIKAAEEEYGISGLMEHITEVSGLGTGFLGTGHSLFGKWFKPDKLDRSKTYTAEDFISNSSKKQDENFLEQVKAMKEKYDSLGEDSKEKHELGLKLSRIYNSANKELEEGKKETVRKVGDSIIPVTIVEPNQLILSALRSKIKGVPKQNFEVFKDQLQMLQNIKDILEGKGPDGGVVTSPTDAAKDAASEAGEKDVEDVEAGSSSGEKTIEEAHLENEQAIVNLLGDIAGNTKGLSIVGSGSSSREGGFWSDIASGLASTVGSAITGLGNFILNHPIFSSLTALLTYLLYQHKKGKAEDPQRKTMIDAVTNTVLNDPVTTAANAVKAYVAARGRPGVLSHAIAIKQIWDGAVEDFPKGRIRSGLTSIGSGLFMFADPRKATGVFLIKLAEPMIEDWSKESADGVLQTPAGDIPLHAGMDMSEDFKRDLEGLASGVLTVDSVVRGAKTAVAARNLRNADFIVDTHGNILTPERASSMVGRGGNVTMTTTPVPTEVTMTPVTTPAVAPEAPVRSAFRSQRAYNRAIRSWARTVERMPVEPSSLATRPVRSNFPSTAAYRRALSSWSRTATFRPAGPVPAPTTTTVTTPVRTATVSRPVVGTALTVAGSALDLGFGLYGIKESVDLTEQGRYGRATATGIRAFCDTVSGVCGVITLTGVGAPAAVVGGIAKAISIAISLGFLVTDVQEANKQKNQLSTIRKMFLDVRFLSSPDNIKKYLQIAYDPKTKNDEKLNLLCELYNDYYKTIGTFENELNSAIKDKKFLDDNKDLISELEIKLEASGSKNFDYNAEKAIVLKMICLLWAHKMGSDMPEVFDQDIANIPRVDNWANNFIRSKGSDSIRSLRNLRAMGLGTDEQSRFFSRHALNRITTYLDYYQNLSPEEKEKFQEKIKKQIEKKKTKVSADTIYLGWFEGLFAGAEQVDITENDFYIEHESSVNTSLPQESNRQLEFLFNLNGNASGLDTDNLRGMDQFLKSLNPTEQKSAVFSAYSSVAMQITNNRKNKSEFIDKILSDKDFIKYASEDGDLKNVLKRNVDYQKLQKGGRKLSDFFFIGDKECQEFYNLGIKFKQAWKDRGSLPFGWAVQKPEYHRHLWTPVFDNFAFSHCECIQYHTGIKQHQSLWPRYKDMQAKYFLDDAGKIPEHLRAATLALYLAIHQSGNKEVNKVGFQPDVVKSIIEKYLVVERHYITMCYVNYTVETGKIYEEGYADTLGIKLAQKPSERTPQLAKSILGYVYGKLSNEQTKTREYNGEMRWWAEGSDEYKLPEDQAEINDNIIAEGLGLFNNPNQIDPVAYSILTDNKKEIYDILKDSNLTEEQKVQKIKELKTNFKKKKLSALPGGLQDLKQRLAERLKQIGATYQTGIVPTPQEWEEVKQLEEELRRNYEAAQKGEEPPEKEETEAEDPNAQKFTTDLSTKSVEGIAATLETIFNIKNEGGLGTIHKDLNQIDLSIKNLPNLSSGVQAAVQENLTKKEAEGGISSITPLLSSNGSKFSLTDLELQLGNSVDAKPSKNAAGGVTTEFSKRAKYAPEDNAIWGEAGPEWRFSNLFGLGSHFYLPAILRPGNMLDKITRATAAKLYAADGAYNAWGPDDPEAQTAIEAISTEVSKNLKNVGFKPSELTMFAEGGTSGKFGMFELPGSNDGSLKTGDRKARAALAQARDIEKLKNTMIHLDSALTQSEESKKIVASILNINDILIERNKTIENPKKFTDGGGTGVPVVKVGTPPPQNNGSSTPEQTAANAAQATAQGTKQQVVLENDMLKELKEISGGIKDLLAQKSAAAYQWAQTDGKELAGKAWDKAKEWGGKAWDAAKEFVEPNFDWTDQHNRFAAYMRGELKGKESDAASKEVQDRIAQLKSEISGTSAQESLSEAEKKEYEKLNADREADAKKLEELEQYAERDENGNINPDSMDGTQHKELLDLLEKKKRLDELEEKHKKIREFQASDDGKRLSKAKKELQFLEGIRLERNDNDADVKRQWEQAEKEGRVFTDETGKKYIIKEGTGIEGAKKKMAEVSVNAYSKKDQHFAGPNTTVTTSQKYRDDEAKSLIHTTRGGYKYTGQSFSDVYSGVLNSQQIDDLRHQLESKNPRDLTEEDKRVLEELKAYSNDTEFEGAGSQFVESFFGGNPDNVSYDSEDTTKKGVLGLKDADDLQTLASRYRNSKDEFYTMLTERVYREKNLSPTQKEAIITAAMEYYTKNYGDGEGKNVPSIAYSVKKAREIHTENQELSKPKEKPASPPAAKQGAKKEEVKSSGPNKAQKTKEQKALEEREAKLLEEAKATHRLWKLSDQEDDEFKKDLAFAELHGIKLGGYNRMARDQLSMGMTSDGKAYGKDQLQLIQSENLSQLRQARLAQEKESGVESKSSSQYELEAAQKKYNDFRSELERKLKENNSAYDRDYAQKIALLQSKIDAYNEGLKKDNPFHEEPIKETAEQMFQRMGNFGFSEHRLGSDTWDLESFRKDRKRYSDNVDDLLKLRSSGTDSLIDTQVFGLSGLDDFRRLHSKLVGAQTRHKIESVMPAPQLITDYFKQKQFGSSKDIATDDVLSGDLKNDLLHLYLTQKYNLPSKIEGLEGVHLNNSGFGLYGLESSLSEEPWMAYDIDRPKGMSDDEYKEYEKKKKEELKSKLQHLIKKEGADTGAKPPKQLAKGGVFGAGSSNAINTISNLVAQNLSQPKKFADGGYTSISAGQDGFTIKQRKKISPYKILYGTYNIPELQQKLRNGEELSEDELNYLIEDAAIQSMSFYRKSDKSEEALDQAASMSFQYFWRDYGRYFGQWKETPRGLVEDKEIKEKFYLLIRNKIENYDSEEERQKRFKNTPTSSHSLGLAAGLSRAYQKSPIVREKTAAQKPVPSVASEAKDVSSSSSGPQESSPNTENPIDQKRYEEEKNLEEKMKTEVGILDVAGTLRGNSNSTSSKDSTTSSTKPNSLEKIIKETVKKSSNFDSSKDSSRSIESSTSSIKPDSLEKIVRETVKKSSDFDSSKGSSRSIESSTSSKTRTETHTASSDKQSKTNLIFKAVAEARKMLPDLLKIGFHEFKKSGNHLNAYDKASIILSKSIYKKFGLKGTDLQRVTDSVDSKLKRELFRMISRDLGARGGDYRLFSDENNKTYVIDGRGIKSSFSNSNSSESELSESELSNIENKIMQEYYNKEEKSNIPNTSTTNDTSKSTSNTTTSNSVANNSSVSNSNKESNSVANNSSTANSSTTGKSSSSSSSTLMSSAKSMSSYTKRKEQCKHEIAVLLKKLVEDGVNPMNIIGESDSKYGKQIKAIFDKYKIPVGRERSRIWDQFQKSATSYMEHLQGVDIINLTKKEPKTPSVASTAKSVKDAASTSSTQESSTSSVKDAVLEVSSTKSNNDISEFTEGLTQPPKPSDSELQEKKMAIESSSNISSIQEELYKCAKQSLELAYSDYQQNKDYFDAKNKGVEHFYNAARSIISKVQDSKTKELLLSAVRAQFENAYTNRILKDLGYKGGAAKLMFDKNRTAYLEYNYEPGSKASERAKEIQKREEEFAERMYAEMMGGSSSNSSVATRNNNLTSTAQSITTNTNSVNNNKTITSTQSLNQSIKSVLENVEDEPSYCTFLQEYMKNKMNSSSSFNLSEYSDVLEQKIRTDHPNWSNEMVVAKRDQIMEKYRKDLMHYFEVLSESDQNNSSTTQITSDTSSSRSKAIETSTASETDSVSQITDSISNSSETHSSNNKSSSLGKLTMLGSTLLSKIKGSNISSTLANIFKRTTSNNIANNSEISSINNPVYNSKSDNQSTITSNISSIISQAAENGNDIIVGQILPTFSTSARSAAMNTASMSTVSESKTSEGASEQIESSMKKSIQAMNNSNLNVVKNIKVGGSQHGGTVINNYDVDHTYRMIETAGLVK